MKDINPIAARAIVVQLKRLASCAILAVLLSGTALAQGQPTAAERGAAAEQGKVAALRSVLERLLVVSPRILAAESDTAGARARADETWRRSYTPTIDLTAEAGKQRYESTTDASPSALTASRGSLRVTQLLTDFGRSEAQVGEANFVSEQSAAVAAATRDGLLLEALTAHWSVVRADLVRGYALQSEASVRNQTVVEDSLVELGRGYESNVLQAKVQLATAEAHRVRAEGSLDIARGRVDALFGALADQLVYDNVILPNASLLPASLDEAKERAQKNNKQLRIGFYRSRAIEQRVDFTDTREFRPRLDLVMEHSRRNDIDVSVAGPGYDDTKVMLRLQFSFNGGLAGSAATEAARRDLNASMLREAETRDLVTEQVHVAWRNLKVAQLNKQTLANQVRIAAKFFEMASAERQMGRRSLLELLTAEVALINAISDLVATEADAAIAGLTLLQAVGGLDADALVIVPTEQVIPRVDR